MSVNKLVLVFVFALCLDFINVSNGHGVPDGGDLDGPRQPHPDAWDGGDLDGPRPPHPDAWDGDDLGGPWPHHPIDWDNYDDDDYDDDHDHDIHFSMGFVDYSELRLPSSMITFAIAKGCDFLMGFIKNYYHTTTSSLHHRTNSSDCDWRNDHIRSCKLHHVDKELCCALMKCGEPKSLVAMSASHDTIARCNQTSQVHAMSSESLIGKRHAAPYVHDPNDVCDDYDSHINVFGRKRHIPDVTASIHSDSNSSSHAEHLPLNSGLLQTLVQALSHLSHSRVMPTQEPVKGRLRRWCRSFSRSINKKYRFNERKFVSRSLYWVVDIYKTAHDHHVPTNYTHGLVGCGMDYAMNAFNVNQWQTHLYNLVQ